MLLWRRAGRSPSSDGRIEVLIGHMGGPFWAVQDEGAWSIPKGMVEAGEDPWTAAAREFREETGVPLPGGDPVDLGTVRQSARKDVRVWALEGDLDLDAFSPGTFEMEWPPRSGRRIDVPEIDAIRWDGLADARSRLVPAQHAFLDRLADLLLRA